MVNKIEEKEPKGISVTLYLKPDTVAALDKQSDAINRSRSWMADTVMREKLGLLPVIGGDKDG